MKGWQKINKVDSSGINKENGKRKVLKEKKIIFLVLFFYAKSIIFYTKS